MSVIPRLQPCERTEREKSTTSSQWIIWETFFSKITSPEQSYTDVLRQDTQHQQQQAPQTYGKSLKTPVQQQEIQRAGLSEQVLISTNSDTLKIATVVQHIMRDLSEAVSEKDKIMIITKIVYLT
jgi:hypothetical protein